MKRAPTSAVLLGISLGGFFDAVLLHQILQWHHLTSGLGGTRHGQISADGLFNALMLVVGLVGGWRLWRGQREIDGRALATGLLLGFGAWHIADAVLVHWLLGWHHVREASPNPILWDIGWMAVFGLLPVAAGLRLARRTRKFSHH